MVATYTSAPGLIRQDAIRELLRSPGPCLTFFLPPYRPGEASPSPAAFLKSKLQEAGRELAARGVPDQTACQLLDPIETLADDMTLAGGSHWSRVIFRSPSVCEQFLLANAVSGNVAIGGAFAIRKIAADFARPEKFYILALFKNHVRLLACSGLSVEPVQLPAEIPETLAEALEFEPPDHDLENRASAGSPAGASRAIRFGTGSGRERSRAHLADYYKLVDRGLHGYVGETKAPLVLAGVAEDVILYRAAATYYQPVEGEIAGSPDASTAEHEPLLAAAYSILRQSVKECQTTAVREALERRTPARFSTHLDQILHAAFEGRVGELYVSRDGIRADVYERGRYRSWGQEDLINLAMVQTILHRGNTCEVPAEALPEGAVAAGLMRF